MYYIFLKYIQNRILYENISIYIKVSVDSWNVIAEYRSIIINPY